MVKQDLTRELTDLIPRMRRFAAGLAGSTDRGDELVQAACERLLRHSAGLRPETRLDSWLYRIVHTRWIDQLRRTKTRSAHLALLEKDESEGASGNAAGIERLMDVRDALAALTGRQPLPERRRGDRDADVRPRRR